MLKGTNGSAWFAMGVAFIASICLASAGYAGGITDTEIVLGTHLDLTGPAASGMPQVRSGTQMRIDEANEAGGVNGRKLRLITEDNGSQPQLAVRAVDKLINADDVFAIVNAYGSGTNAAVVKRAVDARVVYFSPWAASAVLQRISGGSPLLFTTIPNYDTAVSAGLGWMIDDTKAQKVGFIFQEGPFGELMRSGVNRALEARKMKLAADASYKVGDIEFSSQVARMKAAAVDLIVMATVTRETVGVSSEVRKLGWNDVKLITASPGRTTIVLQTGKEAVEGLYGIGNWKSFRPDQDAPPGKPWVESYQRRFNLKPDENALLAYAYTDWFVRNGLAAVGREINSDKVVKALQSSPYEHPIFYGPMRFVGNHIDPETAQVSQVRSGIWTPVSPFIKP